MYIYVYWSYLNPNYIPFCGEIPCFWSQKQASPPHHPYLLNHIGLLQAHHQPGICTVNGCKWWDIGAFCTFTYTQCIYIYTFIFCAHTHTRWLQVFRSPETYVKQFIYLYYACLLHKSRCCLLNLHTYIYREREREKKYTIFNNHLRV